MRKVYVIVTFIFVLLVSFLGITYSYEYNEDNLLDFKLIGPYEVDLELDEDYYEYGVKVIRNRIDVSDLVYINISNLDTSKVGQYKVKYELLVDGNIEYIYRIVNVREYVKPEIKVIGDDVVYLNLYDTYVELGYEVSDNYDTDIARRVITTSNLVVDKVGEYRIEYKAIDSSGNEAVAIRKIIVK